MLNRFASLAVLLLGTSAFADDLPDATTVKPVELFFVENYGTGVVFDHDGNGYVSHGKIITKFSLDGKQATWAETGGPQGHKILADGTHLVCDTHHGAVLHLAADGTLLKIVSEKYNGKKFHRPIDLTLDTPNGGFYFTDPDSSSGEFPIGTVHYVNREGKTSRVDDGLAWPNGIVLGADGKKLYVAEGQFSRILVYEVKGPGELGPRRQFADLRMNKGPDSYTEPYGMCLDAAGNLYVALHGWRQVEVLDPSGNIVGRNDSGSNYPGSLAFGGPKLDQLFVTGSLDGRQRGPSELYRIDLGVKGLAVLPKKK